MIPTACRGPPPADATKTFLILMKKENIVNDYNPNIDKSYALGANGLQDAIAWYFREIEYRKSCVENELIENFTYEPDAYAFPLTGDGTVWRVVERTYFERNLLYDVVENPTITTHVRNGKPSWSISGAGRNGQYTDVFVWQPTYDGDGANYWEREFDVYPDVQAALANDKE